jgi:hypothetical protein
MNVCELLVRLRDADPESVVLFLGEYADSDESDEVREVEVSKASWTHETGRCDGVEYGSVIPETQAFVTTPTLT